MDELWQILRQVLEKLLLAEIIAWLPKLSQFILASAISRLSAERRDKCASEWNERFLRKSGNIAPLLDALRRFADSYWDCLKRKVSLALKKTERGRNVIFRVICLPENAVERFLSLFFRGFWFQDLFN